eukprot:6181816-Pleurochrysis_carterae.AAC.1
MPPPVEGKLDVGGRRTSCEQGWRPAHQLRRGGKGKGWGGKRKRAEGEKGLGVCVGGEWLK